MEHDLNFLPQEEELCIYQLYLQLNHILTICQPNKFFARSQTCSYTLQEPAKPEDGQRVILQRQRKRSKNQSLKLENHSGISLRQQRFCRGHTHSCTAHTHTHTSQKPFEAQREAGLSFDRHYRPCVQFYTTDQQLLNKSCDNFKEIKLKSQTAKIKERERLQLIFQESPS